MSYIIRSQKYYSQIKNGEDFSLNLDDFTTNFVASPGGLTRFECEIDVFALEEFDAQNTVFTYSSDNSIRANRDFRNSFNLADTIDCRLRNSTQGVVTDITIVATVDAFSEDGQEMFITVVSGGFHGTINEWTGYIFRSSIPQACEYNYGLVENDATAAYTSIVDGQDQTWALSPIETPFRSADWSGSVLSGKEGGFYARYAGTGSDHLGRVIFQKFVIRHDFKNTLFWLEGFDENTIPEVSLGNNSLKHVWELKLKNFASSPEEELIRFDSTLGASPWFNERLNGFLPKYSINNVNYSLSGDNADGLVLGSPTTVTFNIQPENSGLISDLAVVVKVAYLPSIDEYAPTQNGLISNREFDEIWQFDSARQTIGTPAVSSSSISNLMMVLDGGTGVNVSLDITTSPANIDETRQYMIWIESGDTTDENVSTSTTPLIVDINNYVFSADIEGLVFVENPLFYSHVLNAPDGKTDYKGWIGDQFLHTFDFLLETSLNANLVTMNVAQAAYNPTTEDLFKVADYSFNISTNTIGSVQTIAVDDTRGFEEKQGSPFNFAKINLGNLEGTRRRYSVELGMRVPWQDWEEVPEANNVFYDATKQHNGLNKNMSNYSNQNGYETVVVVDMDVDSNGILTKYRFISTKMDVFDHNVEDDTPPEWTGAITTKDQFEVPLQGNIISNDEVTKLECTWTHSSGTVPAGDVVSVISIEPVDSSQAARTYASSLRSVEPSTVLTEPVIVTGATNIITHSFTDPNFIEQGRAYNIYARLYASTDVVVPPVEEEKLLSGIGSTPKELSGTSTAIKLVSS